MVISRTLRLAFAAIVVAAAAASRLTAATSDSWQAYADCAAGYRANWQDRLSDPTRTPQMRDMIRSQADDYLAAAVRRYQGKTGVGQQQAERTVQSYVEKNLDRFIAMDKKDELNDFLDKCPQPDESGSL